MTAAPIASAVSRLGWERLSRLARLLIFAILFAILVWLALISFILPQRAVRLRLKEEVRTLAEGAAALRLQLEALRNEARGEEAMRRSLEDVRRQLDAGLAGLPESRALSAFLRDLTAPEEGDGVVFLAITPQPAEKRGEILELPFTLELEGTYQELSRYLLRLEALPRLVTVRQVNLTGAAGKTLGLRATIAAATYVLGDGP